MFRTLYKFDGESSDYISFKAGVMLTVVDTAQEAHGWWLAQNGQGQVGYVPSNYLTPDDDVEFTEVLKSIDRAIETIQRQMKETLRGAGVANKEQETIKKLLNHRKAVVEENRLKRATTTDVHMKTKLDVNIPDVEMTKATLFTEDLQSQKSKRHAPLPPNANADSHNTMSVDDALTNVDAAGVRTLMAEEKSSSCELQRIDFRSQFNGKQKTLCSVKDDTTTPDSVDQEKEAELDGLGIELVEEMRRQTSLSHEMSKVAVNAVLTLLANRVPFIVPVAWKLINDITHDQGTCLAESSDATKLRKILDELTAAKDDSQQRSWFLHEDEQTICNHLDQLNAILDGANPETSRLVLACNGYDACHHLVLYYQMETRRAIRLLLLQTFGSACSLDVCIISELMNSILPLELARDIQNDVNDVQKLNYSVLVLSMLFSTGEAVPQQYYSHLNLDFIGFLLDQIEMTSSDSEDMDTDGLIRLLLAFNLHIELPDENLVMKAIAARGAAKTLTEKLLLMINREADPVKLFSHQKQTQNSVLKFASDLFSSQKTSNLLYTNDKKVLIDIIIRQLTDLSSGDKMRMEYMSLMHLLLKNAEYFDHRHRQAELQKCFQRISQDDKEADMEKDIVGQIWREFPEDFYNVV